MYYNITLVFYMQKISELYGIPKVRTNILKYYQNNFNLFQILEEKCLIQFVASFFIRI